MASNPSRNNHYVPAWYQRRFLAGNRPQLYYLDKLAAPSPPGCGAPAVSKKVPKKCFVDFDLYTTHFPSGPNDAIERYLFGDIDNKGILAVAGFVAGDMRAMHKHFQDLFEYLDTQKLRTPKGLDWIRARYGTLNQHELMREMQGLRLMHCTMWSEGVREIVSTEQSDVTFLVTDHPVTVYNAACPPDDPRCVYPEDPSIEQVGSQTIFALDSNHCLILTNLEYAQTPDNVRLTAPRTNARYRGGGLVRTDAIIRERKLNREEVTAINFLLKMRARRFVASATEDQLYPERSYTAPWSEIGKVLLPKKGFWQFAGETYVRYEDGSTHYQDALGRTSGAHRYLEKKTPATTPPPSDPCPCGNGDLFATCCMDIPEQDRPAWDVYSIRERNLILCGQVQKTLGLDSGKSWDDVRRELNDEHVKQIHETFGALWPLDTDLSQLLPRPNRKRIRAVYVGVADPRTVAASVIAWTPYFDQIVVVHPFLNPARIRPEFSPVTSPHQHREQTLRNVLLLLLLEPYIRAGFVHLVPDPSDLSHELGSTNLTMAHERAAGVHFTRDDMGPLKNWGRDEYERAFRRLPDDVLRKKIAGADPSLRDDGVEVVLAELKRQREEDPLTLLQPMNVGDKGGQLHMLKGLSLEMSLFLAAATGSIVYTDVPAHWRQLHQNGASATPADPDWSGPVATLSAMPCQIDFDYHNALPDRSAEVFEKTRAGLRDLKEAVAARNAAQAPRLTETFEDVARQLGLRQLPDMGVVSRMEPSIPVGGFMRREVTRLLVTFGRAKTIPSIPFALLINIPQVQDQPEDEEP